MNIATRHLVVALACLSTSTANFAAETAHPQQSTSRININRTALADLYTELATLGVDKPDLKTGVPTKIHLSMAEVCPVPHAPTLSILFAPGAETKVGVSDRGLRLTDGTIIKDEGFNVIIRMSKSGTSVEAMEFSPTPLRVRYGLCEFQDQ